MAATIFVQDGIEVDYIPTSDVVAGDVVVQNKLIGVAKHDIPSGKLGALAIRGVFDFPKASGSGTAIAVGKLVYWDATNDVATETSTGNTFLGKTVAAAADGDATVRVVIGTVGAV